MFFNSLYYVGSAFLMTENMFKGANKVSFNSNPNQTPGLGGSIFSSTNDQNEFLYIDECLSSRMESEL